MKLYIDTLGCFKNTEDSERAAGLLAGTGAECVDTPEEADILLVNTCGFIEDAKRESIERILELAQFKEDGKKLIVTGCLAQRYGAELFEEIPEADAVLGVNDYGKLPVIAARLYADRLSEQAGEAGGEEARTPEAGAQEAGAATEDAQSNGGSMNGDWKRFLAVDGAERLLVGRRVALSERYSAYLKIAEGCSNCCAYCAIPAIRGAYRSVTMDDILRDARQLAAEGTKELILIAQDVTAWGIDLYGKYALPDLLRFLCRVEGIEWIRLLYCYEERITDELIRVMAEEPKILHYIDIPLQHVNDALLARMNRRTTKASIKQTMTRLRQAMPDIAIRTTFMTGFPGETEADFQELMDFVSAQRFARMGVFRYSAEEGTAAADMEDQVPITVAEERRERLMLRQLDISLENNKALIGSVMTVMVEGREGDGVWVGRTYMDAPEIDGGVLFESCRNYRPGDMTKVRIQDAMDYDIIGVDVDGHRPSLPLKWEQV
ncbi:MAG: 30S ribosomal protein S12 methylthiotransferase RimO [Clostridiales Family XIII bacterium]|jgi:ribosomal protein S12 methylthiotransferase|nr:30S ribosomal protein S12 methylthiotransferase RimO [Clostridiales Family XIII bacterium]